MKNVFTILVIGLATSFASAQTIKEAALPTAVKDAFTKQHPNTKVDSWEKEGNNYEVEFHLDKIENSIVYSSAGTLIQLETEIAVVELPKAITDYIAKNIPDKKVKEAARIIDPTGNISYEAEVDGIDFIFDANGTIIKKEVEKENDKD